MKKRVIFVMVALMLSMFLATGCSQAENQYDLVVYGGDPEGVAAAISGARNGLDTLLVMEEDGPGGLLVYGALNFLDLNYDRYGRVLQRGIFKEWHQMVGRGIVVDIDQAREAFIRLLLAEENLAIAPVTSLEEVNLSGKGQYIDKIKFKTTGISKTHDGDLDKVTGLHQAWDKMADKYGQRAKLLSYQQGESWWVKADRYIDASQDADLAAEAKAPFFTGGADVGLPDRKMAVTLVFRLKNVDWRDLKKDITSQKWGFSRMKDGAVWGLGKIGEKYSPVNENTKLRGLNIALQQDGTVFINALQIFHLDVFDREELRYGMEVGKKETEHVIKYLRRELAGFQKAELVGFPPQLYVRESRHILSLYQLDILDLIEKVDFEDKIALASYPVDYQATSPVDGGFVVFTPGVYSIPFRSLIPRQKDNLLVVGRSAGYGSLAAGSSRVIPTGMATGQAAGLASALAINEGLDFPEMAANEQLIDSLQRKLRSQGMNLNQISGENSITKDPDYNHFKELFSWGMIVGGYDNDLKLEQVVDEREFAFLLMKGMNLRDVEHYDDYLAGGIYSLSSEQPLRRDKACELLLAAANYWVAKVENKYQTALADGFIPADMEASFRENRLLTRRDIYRLTANFLKKYPIPVELKKLRTRPFGE